VTSVVFGNRGGAQGGSYGPPLKRDPRNPGKITKVCSAPLICGLCRHALSDAVKVPRRRDRASRQERGQAGLPAGRGANTTGVVNR
jgi:hypothetical protein